MRMIADKYIYLLLSLGFFVSALLMLYHREWRKPVMAAGLLGAVAALLVAGFYYADYWRPPTLRGVGVVSFEDALFGFGVAALALCVYGFFEHAHPRNWALNRKHVIHIGILAVVTLGAFVTLTKVLQLNSIVASYTVLMITPGFILIRRHRLWRPCAGSLRCRRRGCSGSG